MKMERRYPVARGQNPDPEPSPPPRYTDRQLDTHGGRHLVIESKDVPPHLARQAIGVWSRNVVRSLKTPLIATQLASGDIEKTLLASGAIAADSAEFLTRATKIPGIVGDSAGIILDGGNVLDDVYHIVRYGSTSDKLDKLAVDLAQLAKDGAEAAIDESPVGVALFAAVDIAFAAYSFYNFVHDRGETSQQRQLANQLKAAQKDFTECQRKQTYATIDTIGKDPSEIEKATDTPLQGRISDVDAAYGDVEDAVADNGGFSNYIKAQRAEMSGSSSGGGGEGYPLPSNWENDYKPYPTPPDSDPSFDPVDEVKPGDEVLAIYTHEAVIDGSNTTKTQMVTITANVYRNGTIVHVYQVTKQQLIEMKEKTN